jgi:ATP-binding cassette subfamily B protein
LQDLATDLFRHCQRLSLSFYNKTPVGVLVTRLTNDIQSLQEMFTSGLVATLSDIVLLFYVLFNMFRMDTELTVVAALALPLVFVSTSFFRRAIRKTYDQIRVRIAKVNAFLNEHITGMRVVQLQNAESETMEEFSTLSADLRDAWLRTVKYMAFYFPFVSLVGGVMMAAVLWYGGGQVVKGRFTYGNLVAFIQYVGMLMMPIRRLSDKYNVFLSAVASAQKVFGVMDNREIIPEPEHPVPLHDLQNSVEFRNVTFWYNPSEPILRNVSFRIGKNERIAIVGATGAGKTTVINLLYRYYDVDAGEIFIDGRPIKDFKTGEIRRHFGLVQQEVFLFSGTILDNIRLGDASITPEQVHAAAELVNADKFIERMPEGYMAKLGERGTGLSTGEKQLLAFARTVVMNPKIMLVLDEATSNIDSHTERLIQEGLEHLIRDRTALIIAHRLSTIRAADRIIVMHKGEVREMGTHSELIRKRGLYYNLYRLQFDMMPGQA